MKTKEEQRGEEGTDREVHGEGVNQDRTTEATPSWAESRGFAHGNPDPIPFPPGQQNYDPAFARRGGEGVDARVGGGPRVFRAYNAWALSLSSRLQR